MTSKRSYDDQCAVARALDVVGERWALLIVRELLLGPKRFTDLRVGLPHARPSVLAQRLRELESVGVVTRRKLPPPASSRVYELTPRGERLEDVVLDLARWGAASLTVPDPDALLGVDSIVLGVRAFFAPPSDGRWTATYELRLGDEVFAIHVHRADVHIHRGAAADADAVIDTDPATFLSLLDRRMALSAARRTRYADVTGRIDLVERLLDATAVPRATSS